MKLFWSRRRRNNFAYTQIAAQQRRRQAAAILLHRKQPKLVLEELNSGSSIVVATIAARGKLMELYRAPSQLQLIDRRQFEEVVAELFSGFGYSVELTAQTRDGGRDIVAVGRKDQIKTKYLIECKRPDPGNPVSVGVVRQLLGVVEDEKATKGLLVATTYFTRDARALEERNEWRLELKDYNTLIDWIEHYVRLTGF